MCTTSIDINIVFRIVCFKIRECTIEGGEDRQNTTDFFYVMQILLVSQRQVSAFVGHFQVSKF
jgi:hypothetical protein